MVLIPALFAVVFTVRYLFGTPDDGLAFLYLLPICLIANERGVHAGVGAGVIALMLFGVWDQLDSQHAPLLGYATRGLVFVGVGALCGSMAARARRAGEESDRYFELSSQMLGIFTLEGRPTRLNGRWSEVLGWTPEELRVAETSQLVHPDDLGLATSKLAATAETEHEVRFTVRMFAADGRVRHIQWTSTVDRDQDLIYTAAQDVTERHELDAARRQAEERFRVAAAGFWTSWTGSSRVVVSAAAAARCC